MEPKHPCRHSVPTPIRSLAVARKQGFSLPSRASVYCTCNFQSVLQHPHLPLSSSAPNGNLHRRLAIALGGTPNFDARGKVIQLSSASMYWLMRMLSWCLPNLSYAARISGMVFDNARARSDFRDWMGRLSSVGRRILSISALELWFGSCLLVE